MALDSQGFDAGWEEGTKKIDKGVWECLATIPLGVENQKENQGRQTLRKNRSRECVDSNWGQVTEEKGAEKKEL